MDRGDKPGGKRKHTRNENIIPAYEHLFDEGEKVKKKKGGFFTKILKINKFRLILSAFLYVIKASPIWISPVITAEIINVATDPGDDALVKIAIYAAVLTLVFLQNIPMHMLNAKLNDNMVRTNSAAMKSMVVRKLQRLSITYYKQMESGRIHSKFLKDLESVDQLFHSVINVVIPSVINVLISVAISIARSGTVTLFFLLIIPCNVFLAVSFRKIIRERSRDVRRRNEDVSVKLNTMLEMLSVTKAHGLEEEEIVSLEHSIGKLKKAALSADKTNAYFGSMSWVLSNLLSSLCLIFCAYLAIKGKIGVGDIVLYQSLFGSINGNVLQLINLAPQFGQGADAVSSISEIMLSEDIENNYGKLEISGIHGDVRFENVSYRYPDSDQLVIKDFNLDVKQGECIAVVGSSGSGKSTIMNLIIGFLMPTSGHVYIDGNDISGINLTEYRHCISVVPQNSILFSGTIKENITYGLPYYSEERLAEVLEQANINEFLKDLPNGVETNIGEHGGMLSGGQKQRITIARALIRNPQILIFDEATSALDNISEYNVQKAITAAIKGRTTFIVAHRLSTIRNADRIIVMDGGVAAESGTYEQLMDKKGKFYELKLLNDANSKTAETALG